eukprot:9132441-Pyramimonas_sp.AAC.1
MFPAPPLNAVLPLTDLPNPPSSPSGPRVAERLLQDAQDGLKMAQEASETPQEASKRSPKRSPR